MEVAQQLAVDVDIEVGAARAQLGDRGDRVELAGVAGQAVAQDLAAGGVQHVGDPRVAAPRAELTIRMNERAQQLERARNGRKIGVDVGVIELDAGQDRVVGPVVHELGALVVVGGVVLVALDDERGPAALREALAEVERDAAHEQAGVAAGRLEQPRGERGGGRLAVGAADDHGGTLRQQPLAERLGEGRVGQVRRAHRHGLGVVAADDVADDDKIGAPIQVLGAVALLERDAPVDEVGAHRVEDAGVAAAHLEPAGLQHPGEVAHRRAADAHQVHALDPAVVDVGTRLGHALGGPGDELTHGLFPGWGVDAPRCGRWRRGSPEAGAQQVRA